MKRGPYHPKTGGMTYAEIAAVLGISHQRVHQLEQQALAKLKRFAHLKEFVEPPRDLDPSIYNLDPY